MSRGVFRVRHGCGCHAFGWKWFVRGEWRSRGGVGKIWLERDATWSGVEFGRRELQGDEMLARDYTTGNIISSYVVSSLWVNLWTVQ